MTIGLEQPLGAWGAHIWYTAKGNDSPRVCQLPGVHWGEGRAHALLSLCPLTGQVQATVAALRSRVPWLYLALKSPCLSFLFGICRVVLAQSILSCPIGSHLMYTQSTSENALDLLTKKKPGLAMSHISLCKHQLASLQVGENTCPLLSRETAFLPQQSLCTAIWG